MTSQTLLMEHMTWTAIRDAMDQGFDTAILFTGSIEQHGPHLPLATDTLLSYALAERVAVLLGKSLVAPVVSPGISDHHMAWPGTITVSAETFKAVTRDCIVSLAHHGFKRVIVAWGHGGNTPALNELLPLIAVELPHIELVAQADVPSFYLYWKDYAQEQGINLESLGIHAGEGETSMMLAHRPDLVDIEHAEQGFMGDFINNRDEFASLLHDGLDVVTANGVLGDPVASNQQRGATYLDLMARYFVDSFEPVLPPG